MNITAVLSMLHEPAGQSGSATRRFRGEAPLAWTLFRLARCPAISKTVVLCWEDQAEAVAPIAAEQGIEYIARSARMCLPHLDSVSAARRWADGWRGGPLWTCEFDRGFYGPWVAEIAQKTEAEAVLLVDPSAGLVDPDLISSLIEHAASQSGVDFYFSQAAPGLSGVLLRRSIIGQLATDSTHPGTLLGYLPDLPMRDPISAPSCVPVATSLARTPHRFTLDSERQIDRIASATVHLNGQLISTEAEQLVRFLDASSDSSTLPREVVLELNTRRAARPIYSAATHIRIDRPDLSGDAARILIQELASADDLRLVLGGVGDPLLYPDLFAMVDEAKRAGIGAIALETDLLGVEPGVIDQLADSPVDIISVNFPAICRATYQAIMGVDGFKLVMENLAKLISRRQSNRRGTPLVVPTFIKTTGNMAEMEAWYDHWLRVLGCAVINGPSDFAEKIADVSVAQMEPPRRQACARLARRLTVLCDGRVVSCEQDILGEQSLGRIGENSIQNIWTGAAAALGRDHAAGQWNRHPICAKCKEWHRP
ncbi:MAG TPA: SPASM domain-containing protein [Tepidisphaeraceae bacterium]|nr:SPASM domain-containing protein [Tepidisphaeraceae bacterium]